FAAGRDKIFMQVNNSGTGVDSKKLIQEYSPNIRHESLETGLEVNLKMLELLAGLSAGILTKPVTTFATATEMKAGLQNTFAFITKFRKSLEKSTNDLLYAVNVLCNANDITPMGDWTAEFDWSDGYIENMQDRFNQLMQAESIGAIEKAEVRAWTMNEDLETAQSRTKEIAETEPKIEFTGAE
ncbi:MAG: phage portal protein, partial [Oscillospiraceae bacterium]